jgi:hypothetical protein
MERIYEDERRKLKDNAAKLEQKLESTTHSLNVAESTLASRNAEVDTLQNTLKELDELREFKAVCVTHNIYIQCFLGYVEIHILSIISGCRQKEPTDC